MIFLCAFFAIFLVFFLAKYVARVNMGLRGLNLLSVVFYRDYMVFTILALSFWLYKDNYQGHYVLQQVSAESFYYAIFASAVFMSFFYVFARFWNVVLARSVARLPEVGYKLFSTLLMVLTFLLFFYVVAAYISNPPPITKVFSGLTPLELATLRHGAGGSALQKIVRMSWVPIVFYTWFYIYLRAKDGMIDAGLSMSALKFFVIFSFFLASVCSVWSLQKSLFGSFILGMLGVYLISRWREIGWHTMLALLGVLLSTIFAFYFLLSDAGTDIGSLAFTMFTRFFAQAAGVAYAFYAYPDILEFKYFSGVSNTLATVQGESFSSPYSDIIDYAVPEYAEISGAMSSFAAGEAYGLFGWFGVLLGPLFASFWYVAFYLFARESKVAPVLIGMYGIYFGNAYLASSFYSFIWPVGLLISMMPILFIYFVSSVASK